MIDDPVAAMAGAVSAGVAEMADAITAVLTEIDVAGQAVVDALNAALAGAWNPGDPTGGDEVASRGPTNWAAYSHDELYRMLREQADVGDVSEIAAEWGRHADALTGHADTLREQRAALTANWRGEAAERATERIDQLAGLVGAIGARARQVRQAAQDSADALARARNTMPPPPGRPPLTAAGDGPDAERPPTATTSGDGVVFAVGAVFVGGTSMFDADFLAGSAKSRAEEVMRGYESSLHGSDALITPPVQAAMGDADLTGLTTTSGFTPPAAVANVPGGGGGGGGGNGVPWSQLTHVTTPDNGGATGRSPLQPGVGAPVLRTAVNHLQASGRVPAGTGFTPFMTPMARSDGDKDHKRQQPNVVRGLFADDRIPSKPVIGE
ncbi:WXG100 family type VII secretion target [Saccharothrix sp. S26]|uniref:WXG100 family type VII secretion target n=1 Tax=Saccharothrix sp. S26 TaxID=2907215 RepID=UPI001F1F2231|nr:WXG100 family type VII secretion target [Saccharothrix sp. S26]MCE6997294.1 WXG100 family type VII secretion target [Saccharothrix sp. S26]